MTLLKLTDQYSMAIERGEKKSRLVVYKNGIEDVCRKEDIREIERFISSGEGQLFKGRLRLYKHDHELSIEVKGNSIAVVNAGNFMRFLRE